MPRFCVITPTIGRAALRRCIDAMDCQMFRDFVHVVVGDGPQPDARVICQGRNVCYFETAAKEERGAFGAAPRNYAIDKLIPDAQYVLFVDDDNVLLEPALYRANITAADAGDPPLLYHEILFTGKFTTDYVLFPKDPERLVVEREWDLLNGIFRRDTIGSTRFQPLYRGDYLFAREISERHGNQWVKVPSFGGIHHLSWDTFDG